MSTVNTQVADSVADTLTSVIGNAPAEGFALLDTVMAETVGMLMHNAVNSQTNAQMIGNAAVTATCAKMLSVPVPQRKKKSPPTSPPVFSPPVFSPSGSGSPNSVIRKTENALENLAKDAKSAGSNEAQAMKNLQELADAARKSTNQS